MITGTDQRERAQRKIVQYLNEAHATELGLTRVLQSQIAMTPGGSYRTALERHLARRARTPSACSAARPSSTAGGNPLGAGVGARRERASAQVLALSKTPFDLLRGSGGEEKILKNAKDTCATEALEIATYTALEHARPSGRRRRDGQAGGVDPRRRGARCSRASCASCAALTAAVVGAEVEGDPSYDVTDDRRGRRGEGDRAARARPHEDQAHGAQGAQRAGRRAGRGRASRAPSPPRRTCRSPATTQLTAEEIAGKLGRALADRSRQGRRLRAQEREPRDRPLADRHPARQRAVAGLRRAQRASEIRTALADADDERVARVREYERAHKNRAGVLSAAERELATA